MQTDFANAAYTKLPTLVQIHSSQPSIVRTLPTGNGARNLELIDHMYVRIGYALMGTPISWICYYSISEDTIVFRNSLPS